MGLEAATKALLDAGVTYDVVEAAYVGYCYGDSTSGQVSLYYSTRLIATDSTLLFDFQRALYNLGLTGIPITNVNNNCSTGSTALYQAANLIRGSLADCTIALGFERMSPGSLKSNWSDRPPAMMPFMMSLKRVEEIVGENQGLNNPRMFENAAVEYFKKYGGGVEHLAKIGMRIVIFNAEANN